MIASLLHIPSVSLAKKRQTAVMLTKYLFINFFLKHAGELKPALKPIF